MTWLPIVVAFALGGIVGGVITLLVAIIADRQASAGVWGGRR